MIREGGASEQEEDREGEAEKRRSRGRGGIRRRGISYTNRDQEFQGAGSAAALIC
jgi:hypothetical protein